MELLHWGGGNGAAIEKTTTKNIPFSDIEATLAATECESDHIIFIFHIILLLLIGGGLDDPKGGAGIIIF